MSMPMKAAKGEMCMSTLSEVQSELNALQLNPNYKNNEAAAGTTMSNKAPAPIEKTLGNPFGGKGSPRSSKAFGSNK